MCNLKLPFSVLSTDNQLTNHNKYQKKPFQG